MLWLFGLTALTLVFASLLLLGLLAQGVVADASASGFVTGIAVVTSILGLAALTYVLTTARRAGYLRSSLDSVSTAASQVTEIGKGLVTAPVVPAGYGARRRRMQRARRDVRRQQARAIAAAHQRPAPVAASVAVPVVTERVAPRPAVVSPARPVRARPPAAARRVAPTAGRTARPGPARSVRLSPPRPVRVMPPQSAPARPSDVPTFLRMSTGPARPGSAAAVEQVRGAAIRETRPYAVVRTARGGLEYRPPKTGATA
jgi:hypothetical protein